MVSALPAHFNLDGEWGDEYIQCTKGDLFCRCSHPADNNYGGQWVYGALLGWILNNTMDEAENSGIGHAMFSMDEAKNGGIGHEMFPDAMDGAAVLHRFEIKKWGWIPAQWWNAAELIDAGAQKRFQERVTALYNKSWALKVEIYYQLRRQSVSVQQRVVDDGPLCPSRDPGGILLGRISRAIRDVEAEYAAQQAEQNVA